MTEYEMAEWLRMVAPLTDGPNGRIAIIEDLLDHANEDGMSQDDRTICCEALLRLAGG